MEFCHETLYFIPTSFTQMPFGGSAVTNRKGHISLYDAIPQINPPTLTESKKTKSLGT